MAVTSGPEVYHLGGAWEDRYTFVDAEAFAAGDLIRITSSGTVKMADAASAGAVHGMALEAGTTAGDAVAVLLFAPDTVLKMQVHGAYEPEELTKGVSYALDITTKKHSVTTTTTNGVAQVVGYAGDAQPFGDRTGTFDEAQGVDNHSVLVKFTAATLDTKATA